MSDNRNQASAAVTAPRPDMEEATQKSKKPKRQPRYNVILWDDDHHSYEYVINMMMELFRYTPEKSYQIARCVDRQGKAIVLTTTKEHAELKRDQIHAYGKDVLLSACKGSMFSTIEAMG